MLHFLLLTPKDLRPIPALTSYSHFFYVRVHDVGTMFGTHEPSFDNSTFLKTTHSDILSIGTPMVASLAQAFPRISSILTIVGKLFAHRHLFTVLLSYCSELITPLQGRYCWVIGISTQAALIPLSIDQLQK